MSLIAALPDIDKRPQAVYVMHEKLERFFPVHTHTKGQLSYVEGGIAYVKIYNKTFVIPSRHYFWIPKGLEHVLTVSHSATVMRSIFFYAFDDEKDPFYNRVGIYPINELLLQMLKHSDNWEGPFNPGDKPYQFLSTIKNILPDISLQFMPIALPSTENDRIRAILVYMENRISENHTLQSISDKFGFSNRSLSRLFKATLDMSFLQYLKLLRMVKAFEMLLQTEMTVTEVAYAIGYHSVSAFSNTFSQFTNQRPSDFSYVKN
jgi:AraC-like DNA-binding protein